ncbi:CBS domain-containing protein, partial [Teichococcus rhizosphaerae]
MTRDPVVVPPTMTVEAVAQLLAQRHISAAFVVDAAGLPIGVVSEGDLIRRLAPSAEETGLGWLA